MWKMADLPLCRVCGDTIQKGRVVFLFESASKEKYREKLSDILNSPIIREDNLPHQICNTCSKSLLTAHSKVSAIRQKVKATTDKLQQRFGK